MGATAKLTGSLKSVETFAAGDHPGDEPGEVWPYTEDDVKAIARNFALLSKGENPLHRVPVTLTHDGTFAYGWASGAKAKGDLLLTDWEDVAPELEEKIRQRRLVKVSAEIKRDFKDRDGKVYPGPYLYRIAILGADVPRVKGLKDIPASFADAGPKGQCVCRESKFTEATMDRAAAIKYLTGMGIDPSTVTDAVPDDFLIAVAQAWQGAEGGKPTNPKAPMSDPTIPDAAGAPKKVTLTQQFSDLIKKTVDDQVVAGLKRIEEAAGKEQKARQDREGAERQQQVRLFCDQRAREGRLSPADNDEASPLSVRSRLLRLAAQPQTVHKFADPVSKATVENTELQLQEEEIAAREPRRFAEKAKGGTAGTDAPAADPLKQRLDDYYKRQTELHDARSRNHRN